MHPRGTWSILEVRTDNETTMWYRSRNFFPVCLMSLWNYQRERGTCIEKSSKPLYTEENKISDFSFFCFIIVTRKCSEKSSLFRHQKHNVMKMPKSNKFKMFYIIRLVFIWQIISMRLRNTQMDQAIYVVKFIILFLEFSIFYPRFSAFYIIEKIW